MRAVVVLLVAAALAVPGVAGAKRWPVVSIPSGGVVAGETWTATLTIPLYPGAKAGSWRPELVFTNLDSWEQRRFGTVTAGRPGVFRAGVRLPTVGTWTVYVYERALGAVTPDPHSRKVIVRAAEERSSARLRVLAPAAVLSTLALVLLRRRAPRAAASP